MEILFISKNLVVEDIKCIIKYYKLIKNNNDKIYYGIRCVKSSDKGEECFEAYITEKEETINHILELVSNGDVMPCVMCEVLDEILSNMDY